MSTTDKIVSFQEFNHALKIVAAYCKQVESTATDIPVPLGETINLEGQITNRMFNVLIKYYSVEYNIDLKPSDLQTMYVNLLEAIDYDKLANFRGLGKVGIMKFKRIMQSYSVIE